MNQLMFKLGVSVLKFEQKRLTKKKDTYEKEIEKMEVQLEKLDEILIRIR